jgi:hypothetical protein
MIVRCANLRGERGDERLLERTCKHPQRYTRAHAHQAERGSLISYAHSSRHCNTARGLQIIASLYAATTIGLPSSLSTCLSPKSLCFRPRLKKCSKGAKQPCGPFAGANANEPRQSNITGSESERESDGIEPTVSIQLNDFRIDEYRDMEITLSTSVVAWRTPTDEPRLQRQVENVSRYGHIILAVSPNRPFARFSLRE